MLTVPAKPLCSWEHDSVTGGSRNRPYSSLTRRGNQAGDNRIGDQGEEVAVLFEAADRQHRHPGGAVLLIPGAGHGDQWIHGR